MTDQMLGLAAGALALVGTLLVCAALMPLARRAGWLDQPDARKLHDSITKPKLMRPPTDCISPIGEDLLIESLARDYPDAFLRAVSRPPTVYRGNAFGAAGVGVGEVCFNTSLTGYQEILTDPSYAGQLVAMTYTQIGNVGVNPDDEESEKPHLQAFIAKEVFHQPSNWRSTESMDAYLKRHGVPGIAGIDTRALVRRIRDGGAQVGVVCTDPSQLGEAALLERARTAEGLDGRDLICDPGTYRYTVDPAERDRYRSVRAHFAPRVGSREPGSLELGMWRLGNEARATLEFASAECLQAVHYGYGAAVRRRIWIENDSIKLADWGDEGVTVADPGELYACLNGDGGLLACCPGYGVRYA